MNKKIFGNKSSWEEIKELLKEFPDLEADSEKIMEAVSLLKAVDPKIITRKDFKEKLREKMILIENYEKKEYFKIKYFNFFIPVLSLGFVIFGFFAFGGNIDFFNQKQEALDIVIQTTSIDGEEGIPEIESMSIRSFSDDITTDTIAPKGAPVNMLDSSEKVETLGIQTMGLMADGMIPKEIPVERISDEQFESEIEDLEAILSDNLFQDLLSDDGIEDLWGKEILKLIEQGCEMIKIDVDGNTCNINEEKTDFTEGCTEMITTEKLKIPICITK